MYTYAIGERLEGNKILDGSFFAGKLSLFSYISVMVASLQNDKEKGQVWHGTEPIWGLSASLTHLLTRIPMAVMCDVCPTFPLSPLLADSAAGPFGIGRDYMTSSGQRLLVKVTCHFWAGACNCPREPSPGLLLLKQTLNVQDGGCSVSLAPSHDNTERSQQTRDGHARWVGPSFGKLCGVFCFLFFVFLSQHNLAGTDECV